MATRCCWPPDSSAGRWRRRSARPTEAITSSSQARVGAACRRCGREDDVLLGRERRQEVEELEDEADVAAAELGEGGVAHRRDLARRRSRPTPSVGRSRPARMCMRVDLPEPEGPITATSSPGSATESETPAQGVHRGVAVAVAADEVAGHDDRVLAVAPAGSDGGRSRGLDAVVIRVPPNGDDGSMGRRYERPAPPPSPALRSGARPGDGPRARRRSAARGGGVIPEDDRGPPARPTPPAGAGSSVSACDRSSASRARSWLDAVVVLLTVFGAARGVVRRTRSRARRSALTLVALAWGAALLFRRRYPCAAPRSRRSRSSSPRRDLGRTR